MVHMKSCNQSWLRFFMLVVGSGWDSGPFFPRYFSVLLKKLKLILIQLGERIIPPTLQKGLTIYILFYLTGFHTQGKNISRTNLVERFKIGYFWVEKKP